jgi:hypothetical protein
MKVWGAKAIAPPVPINEENIKAANPPMEFPTNFTREAPILLIKPFKCAATDRMSRPTPGIPA